MEQTETYTHRSRIPGVRCGQCGAVGAFELWGHKIECKHPPGQPGRHCVTLMGVCTACGLTSYGTAES